MHSWVGITVASAFAFNYLGGLFFEVAKRAAALEGLVPHVRRLHKTVGLLTYGVSAMAILTGISVFQGHSCQRDVSSPDWNPAAHYPTMSEGCKVANGLGIAVLATVLLVLLSVVGHYRMTDLSAVGTAIDEDHGERDGLYVGQEGGQEKRVNAQGNGAKNYTFCFDNAERDKGQSGAVREGATGGQIPQSYQRQQQQQQQQ
jgi:hypothetical protein